MVILLLPSVPMHCLLPMQKQSFCTEESGPPGPLPNGPRFHRVTLKVFSIRLSGAVTAENASPAVKTDAPRSTISFNKNWPGKAESAGNPSVGSQPGVVTIKLNVVRNIPTESRLAMPEMGGVQ